MSASNNTTNSNLEASNPSTTTTNTSATTNKKNESVTNIKKLMLKFLIKIDFCYKIFNYSCVF